MWEWSLSCPICGDVGVWCDCDIQLRRWAEGSCPFCGEKGRRYSCPCDRGVVGRVSPPGIGFGILVSLFLHWVCVSALLSGC